MDVERSPANVLSNPWFLESGGLNNNKLARSCSSHYDFHNDNSADINANQNIQRLKCQSFNSTWKLGDLVNYPMMGVLHNQPEVSGHRIPMDFSPYLLSASPPKLSGFDITSYSSQYSTGHIGFSPSSFHIGNFNSYYPSPINRTFDSNANLNKRRNGLLKSIIVKPEVSSDTEGSCLLPESPHSPGKVTKKVSFADHKGLALAHVRLVKESPDEPPHLNPDILSSLTKGAIADVTCKPPIKLCFPQPASDFLAFRDKVSTNLVMLENVLLKDYTVEGTIKVKNISFEKHVFVRLSLDDWETFEDTDATYVPGLGLSYSECFDTFSFKVDIAPNFNVSKTIQFAVCFEENGNQHWDSSDGTNYCIVSENYEASKLTSAGSLCSPRWLSDKSTETWSEFSVLPDKDTSTPYY